MWTGPEAPALSAQPVSPNVTRALGREQCFSLTCISEVVKMGREASRRPDKNEDELCSSVTPD